MEKTVYEKWNNIVIENHSPEIGSKIIEWWKSKGVETKMLGSSCKGDFPFYFLYGIINGQFSIFNKEEVKSANARILQWSEVEAFEKMKEKEWVPEYGERVLVWDEDESAKCEVQFHSKTNGFFWVFASDTAFLNEDYKNSFDLLAYKNCEPLPKYVFLTAEEISQGKGTGVDPKLIRFNINEQN